MNGSLQGVFVTGTDTNVGKTVVSAWLTQKWQATYWKPIQSGAIEGLDRDTVSYLAQTKNTWQESYVLQQPLSPHFAAAHENVIIDLAKLEFPPLGTKCVVEGAGGVLVPLNDHQKIIDLIEFVKLPVVLVARTALGTINHTLLTVEALQRRQLPIWGIILSGKETPNLAHTLEHYSGCKVKAHLPILNPLTPESLASCELAVGM